MDGISHTSFDSEFEDKENVSMNKSPVKFVILKEDGKTSTPIQAPQLIRGESTISEIPDTMGSSPIDEEPDVLNLVSIDPGAEGDSGEMNSFENSIITPAMVAEEERLRKLFVKEQEKQRKLHEKKIHDQEMKELRYKRLMNLLEKSQFYANFMMKKVNQLSGSTKKAPSQENGTPIKASRPRKRRRNALLDDFSEQITSACKKEVTSKRGNIPDTKSTVETDSSQRKPKTVVTSLGIEVPAEQPALLEGGSLRDYQLEGFNWLKMLFESGMNGILADEMGLGKTIQVISLLCHLYECRVSGPFLVVGPLSTLPNWLLEFQRFAPQLPVILYHGPEKERRPLRTAINTKSPLLGHNVYPVVLTSYEVPVRDAHFMSSVRWKYIIVDEGHRLKNYKTQLAQTLSRFSSVNRLLLTGTPLQNNLTELWSLLHFLLPDIFDTLDTFESWFEVEDIQRSDMAEALVEQEEKDKVLSSFHQILSPFLLRRVKSDVNLYLPPKKEILVYCPMSLIQRRIYEAILDRSIVRLLRGGDKADLIIPDNPDGTKVKRYSALRENLSYPEQPKEEDDILMIRNGDDQYILDVKLQNPSMALRKAVNHPYLINLPVLPGSSIMRVDEGLVTDCGKMAVLDGLLSRLKQRGHKVILFSTFTSLLDLVEEFVIMRGYDYERLDGKCDLESRRKSIHRFNTDAGVFVFLISTRAGGLGINLMSADTAIIYDSDWNPQADLQAQDRCHRIGQTRPVVVYRFITEGSLDEKIYARATAKRTLEKIIIQGGNFNKFLKNTQLTGLDLENLKEMLKSKPECRELRANGLVLSEEEWNKLLDRSDMMKKNEA